MQVFSTALICTTMALIVASLVTTAHAAEDAKKAESVAKETVMKIDPAAKKAPAIDCEKHMAVSEKHVGKKDDTMKMHDKQCADLVKKEGLLEKSMTKNQGATNEPASK